MRPAPKPSPPPPPAALERLAGDAAGSEVVLHDGEYLLDEPLVFTERHSGEPGRPLRWTAAEGAAPRFTSTTPVEGWRRLDHDVPGLTPEAAKNVWCADVGGASFRTLYEGGEMIDRARKGPLSTDPDRNDEATPTRLCARPEDLGDWSNPSDVELFIMPWHVWEAQYLPVAEVDRKSATITTRIAGSYALRSRPEHSPPILYWLDNVPEGLTGPGGWMLDTSRGTVYLWPSNGSEPADVRVPRMTELMRLEGGALSPCHDIELEGLSFTGADWIHWPEGRRGAQHDWQVHDWPDAMLRLRNTRDVAVRRCRFTDAGATGLRMDCTAAGNDVERCDFARLGGNAIAVVGLEPGQRAASHHNTLRANRIHHIARQWWQASAILVHQSGYNEIVDNHIHDTPYGAITLISGREGAFLDEAIDTGIDGRLNDEDTFGPGPREWFFTIAHLACRHNRVAHNDIHDVMQKIGDGNAVYISGTGWGNVIEANFIHDIPTSNLHSAIRTDDMQWYTRLSRNVVCRCNGAGVTLKHVNDITDNVLVDTATLGGITVRRGPSWGASIRRNIIVHTRIPEGLDKPPLPFFSDGGMSGRFEELNLDDNLLWCHSDPAHAERCLQTMKEKGKQAHGIAADPRFVDPRPRRLQPRPRFARPGPRHPLHRRRRPPPPRRRRRRRLIASFTAAPPRPGLALASKAADAPPAPPTNTTPFLPRKLE